MDNSKPTFRVILHEGQMKRVDADTYQKWKEEKKDHFATSIVQPENGTIFGIYFRGEDFDMTCQDPQVWHLVIDSMTAEDYEKLKEKHPEIEGIDDRIQNLRQRNEPTYTNDNPWEEIKEGDPVDIEDQSVYETFATQSELLRYLKENYINDHTGRAYYLGNTLPFNY